MKIDLTELLRRDGNEADIQEEEKISFPADGLALTRPVSVNLHLINLGDEVLLNGTLATEAELECSRCLKRFPYPLQARIAEKYAKVIPLPRAAREIELKDADFIYPIEKDNTLDLDDIIRQNLLLALPIKVLCEQKCKGE